jgi:hypothetical protein
MSRCMAHTYQAVPTKTAHLRVENSARATFKLSPVRRRDEQKSFTTSAGGQNRRRHNLADRFFRTIRFQKCSHRHFRSTEGHVTGRRRHFRRIVQLRRRRHIRRQLQRSLRRNSHGFLPKSDEVAMLKNVFF